MLRAASSKIPKSSVLRNIRPRAPTEAPPFLPFLYPPTAPLQSRWARHSSNVAADSPPPQRTYFTDPPSPPIPIPDRIASIDGIFRPGEIPNEPAHKDGSSLLIVETPKLSDTPKKRGRGAAGVTQDKHEILSTFEACIRVGRIARAQLMLRSLTAAFEESSPLLLVAHNTFLQALLKRALSENSQDSLRSFFSWYEDNMSRELKLTGDATTIALLLKGSFAVQPHAHSHRYIQQYIKLWQHADRNLEDVLVLDILDVDQAIQVAKIAGLKASQLPENLREAFEAQSKGATTAEKLQSIPAVSAGDVKGRSLYTIRESIKSLIDPDAVPNRHAFGQDDMAFQIERQKLLETDVMKSAHERWKQEYEALVAKGMAPLRGSINALLWSWHQAFVPLIMQELVRVLEAEENPGVAGNADRCLYGPFLRVMTPEKIGAIVILEIIKMQNSTVVPTLEGIKSSQAVMNIGKILEQEYYAQELSKRKNQDIFGNLQKSQIQELFNNMPAFRAVIKKARLKAQDTPQASVDLMFEWPASIRAKLGAVLISMLLHCAKVMVAKTLPNGEVATQHHPAIQHSYSYVKGRRLGMLRLHPDVVQKLGTEPLRGASMGRNLPMLVPPLPWVAWNEGGYYYTRSRVVRTKQSKEQDIYVQTASHRGDLDQLFQGLDVLGQTAWRINKRVFDVVLEVWNKGEAFADIPPREINKELPPEPPQTENPRIRTDWVRQVRALKTEEKNNHSQRCGINLKLEIARGFLFEKFYFPHNVDFRGRAYPIPPNLNHIGDDLSRGLLMFAEAKPLGPTGLRWLKIHCANLAGYDKASFTDRVQYIDDRIADVMDSADRPLEGNRWWLKAEDPWQCLATCISITEALRTPNPEEYMCHTVVAQDGTCNGLQHYAALGGDQEGARQVNLEPSDRPQDVYTGVAELVKAQIEKDVQEEHPLAMLLHGHITRKVVKQSVMTNVYGVTFVGARAQIQKQLEDNPAIPREELTKCAGYLARLVFASISQVFTGATKIQHWLALCARIISRSVSPAQFDDLEDHYNGVLQAPKSETKTAVHSTRQKGKVEFMTSVVWTTPLKMAVVQPYRLEGSMCVQTNLQKIYITDPSVIDQVNSRKQMTAFPPNFIHSLDATHMLLSAMKCYQHGLTFAAVHDSFWTHPSDVDKLAGILREAFIGLHSVDIMERLKEEFETRYKGYKYRVAIPNSSPTAKLIKMARKLRAAELGQINLSEVDDLKWELQRDTYLASDDPEIRKKGETMVTPSVILDHAGGVESTQAKEDLGTTLGVIPETPAEEKKMQRDDDEAVEVEEDVVDEDDEIAEIEESENAEEEEAVEEDEEIEEVKVEKTKKAASKKSSTSGGGGITHVWVPLVFPALPPKGEFDVTRLRESKYFFS